MGCHSRSVQKTSAAAQAVDASAPIPLREAIFPVSIPTFSAHKDSFPVVADIKNGSRSRLISQNHIPFRYLPPRNRKIPVCSDVSIGSMYRCKESRLNRVPAVSSTTTTSKLEHQHQTAALDSGQYIGLRPTSFWGIPWKRLQFPDVHQRLPLFFLPDVFPELPPSEVLPDNVALGICFTTSGR